jgi:hypothetical protein
VGSWQHHQWRGRLRGAPSHQTFSSIKQPNANDQPGGSASRHNAADYGQTLAFDGEFSASDRSGETTAASRFASAGVPPANAGTHDRACNYAGGTFNPANLPSPYNNGTSPSVSRITSSGQTANSRH